MAKKRPRLTDAQKDALTTYWKENPNAKSLEVARVMKVSLPTANTYKKLAGLTKPRGGGKSTNKSGGNSALEVAYFVIANGGLKATIGKVKAVQQDGTIDFIIKNGGVESTLAKLAECEVATKF